jgi:hypothetical protein
VWCLNVPVVHARVVTLHFQSGIRCYGLENKVVIAVWAELVTKKHSKVSHAYLSPERRITIPFFELRSVLAEAFLALLACKDLSHAGQTLVIPAQAMPRRGWALPSPEPSATYGTPALGGIRHSRTTCGLLDIFLSICNHKGISASVQQGERIATWALRMCLLRGC